MTQFRTGYITAAGLGAVWTFVMAICVSVVLSFAAGLEVRPSLWLSLIVGAGLGLTAVDRRWGLNALLAAGAVVVLWHLVLPAPVRFGADLGLISRAVAGISLALAAGWAMKYIMDSLPTGDLTRHEFEAALIKFLIAFGYVFFVAIVLIPFYVMVMTSLKSQQALLQNPLDFSLDLSQGTALFRSYIELFRDFNFGSYLWTSFYVSVLTVALTLLFSIPGAYAVARLRFRGRAAFSRSILLIYMVPMIVLALPIYIVFSVTGLRNTILGLVLIYPVTTIPVALYMLQGYFRGLPAEVEEAGLMDGLTRLQVIWKITLPLSLPALASVSLYVFMIAWNEFLLAFMLLDDPGIFTLTRGVAALNSSEVPRQHLMAGAVVATVPIMVLFLGLEKFMTKGLTAGSVKG